LLESFLCGQGFDTVSAASGEQALAILRAEPVSLMISDVRMPGMSGLETLRQARHEHTVLPVLLVTAYADIRDAVGAMRDGALDYLDGVVEEVFRENPDAVRDAIGDEKAAHFLVGQVMKKTKGKANPAVVNKILRDKLSKKQ